MHIRSATPADIAEICAIWNPIIRDTLITFTTVEQNPATIAKLLEAKAEHDLPFLVADAGKIAGFATYGPFRSGPGYAHTAEHTIILAPWARGQGTGRDLLQAIEDHARAHGIHALIGGVSGANPGGVAFHAACGFRQIATLPQVGRKAEQWLDLVLMQKLL